MRQDLVGYLFDSLDEKERAEIDLARQSPATSGEIEKELAVLERAIQPLKCDDEFIDHGCGSIVRFLQLRRLQR